jgi:hypothetical protein
MESSFHFNKNLLLMSNIDASQKFAVPHIFLVIVYILTTVACAIQVWQESRKDPISLSQDEEHAGTNIRGSNERSSGDATRALVSAPTIS